MMSLAKLFRPPWLIRWASLLVPSQRREEWSKEWLAELHYAQEQGGDDESYDFAKGAFQDALWQQRDFWTLKRVTRTAQSPRFCLATLAGILLLILVASGLLPTTRLALLPLPYRDAAKIVTIAQAGTVSARSSVPAEDVALWRASSQTLESIATYRWDSGKKTAAVSENFFAVLGAKTTRLETCESDCVVLNYEYWRSLHGRPPAPIDGKTPRVAAITQPGFWFLSPGIAMWRVEPPAANARTGVVARLREDASAKEVEAELGAILRNAETNDWQSIVEITDVQSRVRFVFWLFGFCVATSIVIIVPVLRRRIPSWNPRAGAFFVAKTSLLLAALLLFGIEFTRASSITMLGGADGFTAISAWLFVMGSTGALAWSIADQRQRCRVCLKRLGMATYVGCTGCLLLDWAGTELVCVEGHGMLHVPELVTCWQEPDRWTSLDETWQELFERG